MLVRHAMARNPIAVAPRDLCQRVLVDFRRRKFRHAPVVEEGRLVGIVSERDLLRAVPDLIGGLEAEEAGGGNLRTVADVMTPDPLVAEPNHTIDEAAQRMEENRIGCLPVVEEGRLVGLLTVTDVLRGFTAHLEGNGVHKLTLLWSHGAQRRSPDVAALTTAAGAELTALLSSTLENGSRMHLVRVRADGAVFVRLVDALQAAGLLVIGQRFAA